MIQTKTFSNVKVRLTLFLDPYPWIFGTVTERNFRNEKSKAQKHIQIDSMLRSGFFFPQNTLGGHGPAFWIFFSGFTDKG